MDLSDIRNEYTQNGLARSELCENPIDQFSLWLKQGREAGLREPTAMVLATASVDGQPTTRIVLLKAFDQKGFIFFTNFESTKAKQIAKNPHVSLLFPWHDLERQVSINGTAERISTAASLKYFVTRPFGSQVSAWISQQSRVISSRQILEIEWMKMKQKYADGKVPLPSFWGGYCVRPERVEFWQGRINRLHDRFLYARSEEEWKISRLAP